MSFIPLCLELLHAEQNETSSNVPAPRISTLLKVRFYFVVRELVCVIELENCASCGLAAGRTNRAIQGLSKMQDKEWFPYLPSWGFRHVANDTISLK